MAEENKIFLGKLQQKTVIDVEEYKKSINLVDRDASAVSQAFPAIADYMAHSSKSSIDIQDKNCCIKPMSEWIKRQSNNKEKYGLRNYSSLLAVIEAIAFSRADVITSKDWKDTTENVMDAFRFSFESNIGESDRDIFLEAFKAVVSLVHKMTANTKLIATTKYLADLTWRMTDGKRFDFVWETFPHAIDGMRTIASKTSLKEKDWKEIFGAFQRVLRPLKEYSTTPADGKQADILDECLEASFSIVNEALSNNKAWTPEFVYEIETCTIWDACRSFAPRTLKNWDSLFSIFTKIIELNLDSNKKWENIFDNLTQAVRHLFSDDGVAQLDGPSDIAKVDAIAESFVDYLTEACTKKIKNTKAANVLSLILLTKCQTNPEFSKKIQPKTISFLKNFPAELNSNSEWTSVATYFMIPFTSDVNFTKKPSKDAIEMIINVMRCSNLEGYGYGIMSGMQQNSPRVFAPYAKNLIEAMGSTLILTMLPDIFKFNPEPFFQSTERMLAIFEDMEASSRSTLLSFLWNMSKVRPACVKCFIESPVFKDALFSSLTGTMVPLILKEYSNHDPAGLVDWVEDLKMFVSTSPMQAYTVAGLFGIIGRLSGENADRMLLIMDELLKAQVNDSTAAMGWLVGMKNVQEKYPAKASKYIPYIRGLMKSTMDQNVRNCCQMLVDVEDHTDLKSVNQKVDVVEVKVEKVVEEVKEQNVKIEVMETKVVENTAIVQQVKVDVAETKQKVEDVAVRVETVEVKVEQQEVKIQQILDRFDEMNAKISQNCSNFEEIKEYVDKNVNMLKEFIAEVAKKLPNPYKFTSEGKIRRTLMLYFECSKNTTGVCMFTREKPFTTETGDWAKWLKIGFSLFKLTKCLYDKDIFGTVDTVKDIYNDFKSKEDANFLSYISQPFLTSAEQDSLINQLRDQRFFDLFQYDAQNANWCCTKCAKHVHQPTMQLEEKKEPVSNADPQSTVTVTSTTTTLTTSNTGSPKLENHLKVSVGFMKRITKVWCVLEGDQLIMYDKDKKTKKHEMTRSEVVDIKDVDSRVTKRDHSFSIITKSRSYTACAPSAEVLIAWKQALSGSQ